MSKKHLETENTHLKGKIAELEEQLKNLNENTVISSMNDMRDRYNDLVSNSVCVCRYNKMKMNFKQAFGMCKTIENISSLLFDKLMFMVIYIDQSPRTSVEFERFRQDVRSVRDRVQLVLELVERNDDLEYNNECDNEYCELRN